MSEGKFLSTEEAKAAQEAGKALAETAKLGSKTIDTLVKAGAYAADIVGDLPRDMLGIAGDAMADWRMRLARSRVLKAQKLLQDRGVVEVREISPSLMTPLLGAAGNEADSELGELWARLLADALDPARPPTRRSFVEIVKRLDPQEARVLLVLGKPGPDDVLRFPLLNIEAEFNLSLTALVVSFERLFDLNLIGAVTATDNVHSGGAFTEVSFRQYRNRPGAEVAVPLKALGKEFLSAVAP
jgi:hypothetical protein